ncbi:MAG: ChbG/HpnK family deacetylase [Rhodomicrobium sp.]
MPELIINADDYAMDAGVDEAILRLAEKGAVTAASAMVRSPRWTEAAKAAADAPLSLGLHLDMTSPFCGAEFPAQKLSGLMIRAHARLLDLTKLRRELDRQLSLFETARRRPPDFVDGHQHVHHLPPIRDVLLEALSDRYGRENKRIGLRICVPRRWRGVKADIIARTGANSLARLAAERGHPVNSDFAGVYGFEPSADLAGLWQSWARDLRGALPLVMCHVAANNADFEDGDPIRHARLREYTWLASEAFSSLLQQFSLRPVRWPTA